MDALLEGSITPPKFLCTLRQPQLFRQHPELFPHGFHDGYRLKDIRHSKKLNVSYRRIRLRNNRLCTIYPSFVMPYMTALTDDVSTILFLARWVPDWALAEAFHTNPARIYRLINSFGRYNIVKTTVKTVRIPTGLLVDEHHTKRKGQKSYIATTAAEGCVFGSEFCELATGLGDLSLRKQRENASEH